MFYFQDLEVILNPGPMIAPDIIIRQFVPSKVNIDKMMEEAGYKMQPESGISGFTEIPENPQLDETYPEINEIQDSTRFLAQKNIDSSDVNTNSSELKAFSGSDPCRMKYNHFVNLLILKYFMLQR